MKATKTDSVQALLDSATKSTTRKSNHLECFDPHAEELATRFASLSKMNDELQRELDQLKLEIIRVVTPQHEEFCRKRGAHEPTVDIQAGKEGSVRVSFQHRYAKIAATKTQALTDLLGDDFNNYFLRLVDMKVRSKIAADPEKLQAVVTELAQALGAERFAEVFEVDQTLKPTPRFTESRVLLADDVRAGLDREGVKQVVSVTPS